MQLTGIICRHYHYGHRNPSKSVSVIVSSQQLEKFYRRVFTEECLEELESSKEKLIAIKAIFNSCSVPMKRYSTVVVSAWRILGQDGWKGEFNSKKEAEEALDTEEISEMRLSFGCCQREHKKAKSADIIRSMWPSHTELLELERRKEKSLFHMAGVAQRLPMEIGLDVVKEIALRRLRNSGRGGALFRTVGAEDWEWLKTMSVYLLPLHCTLSATRCHDCNWALSTELIKILEDDIISQSYFDCEEGTDGFRLYDSVGINQCAAVITIHVSCVAALNSFVTVTPVVAFKSVIK